VRRRRWRWAKSRRRARTPCNANLTFSHSGASPVCITGYKSTSSLAMMESEDDEDEARALALGEADDDEDDEDEEEDEDAPLGVPMNGAATAKQKVPRRADERAGSLRALHVMFLACAAARRCCERVPRVCLAGAGSHRYKIVPAYAAFLAVQHSTCAHGATPCLLHLSQFPGMELAGVYGLWSAVCSRGDVAGAPASEEAASLSLPRRFRGKRVCHARVVHHCPTACAEARAQRASTLPTTVVTPTYTARTACTPEPARLGCCAGADGPRAEAGNGAAGCAGRRGGRRGR
jgi:hypothetical protein